MARLMIAGAAVALLATPALAAPGFGSSSWTSSSESTVGEVEKKGSSFIDMLLGLTNISFDKQISSTAGKSTRDPSTEAYKCDEQKKAEEEKMAEAKKKRASGPEPVYLAF